MRLAGGEEGLAQDVPRGMPTASPLLVCKKYKTNGIESMLQGSHYERDLRIAPYPRIRLADGEEGVCPGCMMSLNRSETPATPIDSIGLVLHFVQYTLLPP